jgi:hypothetical protein
MRLKSGETHDNSRPVQLVTETVAQNKPATVQGYERALVQRT